MSNALPRYPSIALASLNYLTLNQRFECVSYNPHNQTIQLKQSTIDNRSHHIACKCLKLVSYASLIMPLIAYGLKRFIFKHYTIEFVNDHAHNSTQALNPASQKRQKRQLDPKNTHDRSKSNAKKKPRLTSLQSQSNVLRTTASITSISRQSLQMIVVYQLVCGIFACFNCLLFETQVV